MNHKEAIQAMLNGETLQFRGSKELDEDDDCLYFDQERGKFLNADGDKEDINDLDLRVYFIKPKRWRAGDSEDYWWVCSDGSIFQSQDLGGSNDTGHYKLGNYFKTKDEAEEAAEALKNLWKEYRNEP